MESVTCIAVDWSGAKNERAQMAGIWLAVAESDSLIRLKNGLNYNILFDLTRPWINETIGIRRKNASAYNADVLISAEITPRFDC